MKGRKRHIVVDTQGLLLAVAVHPADVQDRDGAKLVISKLTGRFPRLSLIWADGGYAGKLIEWVATLTGWTLEIVRRPGNSHSFEVLPRRWVVERTFAWLGRHRRLSKDYEALPETTEAWVYTAMIGLMLRRLAHPQLFKHPLRDPQTGALHDERRGARLVTVVGRQRVQQTLDLVGCPVMRYIHGGRIHLDELCQKAALSAVSLRTTATAERPKVAELGAKSANHRPSAFAKQSAYHTIVHHQMSRRKSDTASARETVPPSLILPPAAE